MANQLGVFDAVARSIFGCEIAFFPRGRNERGAQTLHVKQLIDEINASLDDLTLDTTDSKTLLEQVKAGFTEVKQATEYQDQKAARLLTVMAFLTAAAASLFSKFVDGYPLHGLQTTPFSVIASHALFGSYVLLVSLGALVSFHAMQTRFLSPDDPETVGSTVRSLLFFKLITATDPKAWGEHFRKNASRLSAQYVKDYVRETYLIAAKTSDKVRFLEPAQRLMDWAIKVLVAWLVSVGIVVLFPAPKGQMGTTQTPPATQTTATTTPTESANAKASKSAAARPADPASGAASAPDRAASKTR